MKLEITAFTGTAPKLSPNTLPESAAQEAVNVRLNSGSLKSVNTPKLETSTLETDALSVYMLGAPGAAIPLSWITDVDVAASPLADTEYRVYYTGDGVPKKTSLALANSGGGPYPFDWYNLGVPGPAAAPTAPTVSGAGSVPAGTYIYVFTYVAQFGSVLLEESAPSDASAPVTVSGSDGVALSSLPSPGVTTDYNYVYKRIYRSSGTAFRLVAQISLATTTYTDTLADTAILGDALPSTGWLPPPDDLKGILTLPSGTLAGFRNNEIWFSEPGFPHAWPTAYMQTVDSQIVGIKAFGNTLVVATQSYPYMGTGLHPDSFTFQKLPILEPALSKRSLAGDEYGVLYASSNGLVAVGSDVIGVISAKYISRETFAQFAPESFTACVFERRYYGFFSSATYGEGAFVYSRDDVAPVSKLNTLAKGVTLDASTARMLISEPGTNRLFRFDPPDTVPDTYTWKSKLFLMSSAGNFGCFRVMGEEANAESDMYEADLAALNTAIVAANAAAFAGGNLQSGLNEGTLNDGDVQGINGSILQTLLPTISQTIGVIVWAGKTAILTGNFELNTVYRLPSGFRNLGWEITVVGQREVRAIQIASSPAELHNA